MVRTMGNFTRNDRVIIKRSLPGVPRGSQGWIQKCAAPFYTVAFDGVERARSVRSEDLGLMGEVPEGAFLCLKHEGVNMGPLYWVTGQEYAPTIVRNYVDSDMKRASGGYFAEWFSLAEAKRIARKMGVNLVEV